MCVPHLGWLPVVGRSHVGRTLARAGAACGPRPHPACMRAAFPSLWSGIRRLASQQARHYAFRPLVADDATLVAGDRNLGRRAANAERDEGGLCLPPPRAPSGSAGLSGKGPTVNLSSAQLASQPPHPTPTSHPKMVARHLAKRLPAVTGSTRTFATATKLFPDEPAGPKVVSSAIPGTPPSLGDGPGGAVLLNSGVGAVG